RPRTLRTLRSFSSVLHVTANHPGASRHPSSFEEGKFAPVSLSPPHSRRFPCPLLIRAGLPVPSSLEEGCRRRRRGGALVELGICRLDDLRPVREVGLDLRREFFRRVSHRLDSVPVQALEEIRPLDDGDGVVVDL